MSSSRRCGAAGPYHDLSREQFDLVLNMLDGPLCRRRACGELQARSSRWIASTTPCAHGPARCRTSTSPAGRSPTAAYYHLRHLETNALIGELDEEYVWEADIGSALTFGTQDWRIERITHNDVFVRPAGAAAANAPFYRGEELHRDWHFSEQIGLFLETASGAPRRPDLQARNCAATTAWMALPRRPCSITSSCSRPAVTARCPIATIS